MNRLPPLTTDPGQAIPATPLASWLSGFNYVFGYQIKLMRDFWGL